MLGLSKIFLTTTLWAYFLISPQTARAQEDNLTAQDNFAETDSTKKHSGTTFLIDTEVTYEAQDSIYFALERQKMYLYGDAKLTYQDLVLTAHTIELDLDSSLAYAYGSTDTLGNEIGLPVFKDKSGEYTMRTLKYNFKTEKALIKHIVTEQGEGFVIGDRAKKIEDNTYCLKNGKYTTCDHHDHPHFYLNLTKAKVIPGKKTITGPAYLVVEDVKLPLVLPFAIIPATSSYSSGFIVPSYGEESNRGYFLRDGGYYWAASDYFDLKATGDIYTNGSWGSRLASKYKKRYKYGGNFDLQYITNIFSEKDLPDYRKSKDFSVSWSHRQDTKANPFQTFSASVNFSTSSFDQNNVGSIINSDLVSRNTKRSSISYSKRWPTGPFNFSANMMHSQNSLDSTIDLTIPDLTLTMNRIYPFKKKNKIGSKENWYEKISLSYTGNTKNYIHTREEDLSFDGNSLTNDWKNGVKHSIPVAMNLKFLKHFTLSPNFNYTERWYFKSTTKEWDEEQQKIVAADTTSGFNRVYDYGFGVGTSTKIYTFFTPWRKLFGNKVEAIRHVATPSVNFSYRPDFGDPKYGYYDYFEYFDKEQKETFRHDYSYYDGALYGVPGRGKSGSMSLGLGNTLEMKVKSDRDTTGFKKIKILESLNFNTSYNFLADSMRWSNITMSGRTKVLGTNINFGANFDPYGIDTTATGQPIRINESAWNANGKLLRLESANLSFGISFGSDNFKKKDKKDKQEKEDTPPPVDPLTDAMLTEEQRLNMQSKDSQRNLSLSDDGYAKFEIPWDISLNYSMRVIKDQFNKTKMDYDYKITADINLNGNLSLTPKWRINFSTGYNLETKSIAHTNIGITRDLHCWGMRFNLVPVGRYKSYFFSINVNSSLLKDLKYEKRNHPRDNPGFY
ncbi:LPS-assembly protein LptD [Marinilabiliaceae bacterium JC017]|nr:LPS-assembly protein LptD [Marinilabiliaceae bacterium JC017]